MGLFIEVIKDVDIILIPFLVIWLIWTIIMALTHGGGFGGGGVGEGLANAAKGAAKWAGPRAKAERRKESAEAAEISQEAKRQEDILKKENQAIKWLDKEFKRDIRAEITDEINRLRWINKVLERIVWIRDAEQANRYRRMVAQQLGYIVKEFTHEYGVEKQMLEILARLNRFEDIELNSLKKEQSSIKTLKHILKRRIRRTDEDTKERFLRHHSRDIVAVSQKLKKIVIEKEELITRMRNDLKILVERKNQEYERLIHQIIDDITHDRIADGTAAHHLHDAIRICEEKMKITEELDSYINDIEKLENAQNEIEQDIQRLVQVDFESFREESERTLKHETREEDRIRREAGHA